jgi:hypothetical protein
MIYGVFDYENVRPGDECSSIVMRRRHDGKAILLVLGSHDWRIIHFIAFRKNAENCDRTTPEIPNDVQNDIENMVWERAGGDRLTKI